MRKSVGNFSHFLMVRRAFGEGPLWGGTPKAEQTPVLYYGGKFHQTSSVHLFLYPQTKCASV